MFQKKQKNTLKKKKNSAQAAPGHQDGGSPQISSAWMGKPMGRSLGGGGGCLERRGDETGVFIIIIIMFFSFFFCFLLTKKNISYH